MSQGTVALRSTMAEPEAFKVEDLYELQRRQGKLKPPVISYEQRRSLKKTLGRQDSLDCSLVRVFGHAFQDFGSLSGWLLWNPFGSFDMGFQWVCYAFFGSAKVDDIVSGRQRMARRRTTYRMDQLDILHGNRNYDPHQKKLS